MKLYYKKLSELIEVIDNKNRDNKYDKLLGININKQFMDSVANIVGTDLSKYKVIKNEYFACNLMHVGRDKKIPMALYKGTGAIVSPAYYVFKVKNKEEILPEYLELFFNKEEFDNKMYFLSQNGIRGNLDWKDFINEEIAYPSLEEQYKIIKISKLIDKNIKVNININKNLNEVSKILYQKYFIDNEKNFEEIELSEIADVSSGKRPSEKFIDKKDNSYAIVGAGGIMGYTSDYNLNENVIIIGRVGTLGIIQRYNSKIWASDNTIVIKSKYLNFIENYLQRVDYLKLNRGGVQPLITQTDIKKLKIKFEKGNLEDFENKMNIKQKQIENNNDVNEKLTNLKKTLINKAMSGELDLNRITL